MIIIGVIMHHYTRGGRFHLEYIVQGGGVIIISDSVPSIIIILGSPVVGKSLPLDNHHYLDHHQPSSLGRVLPTICSATSDQHRQRPRHHHSD